MLTLKFITKEQLAFLAQRIAEHLFELNKSRIADKVLTKKQVAEMLGKSPRAIDKMCDRGQIPFHIKDGHRYFSHNEILDHFISSQEN